MFSPFLFQLFHRISFYLLKMWSIGVFSHIIDTWSLMSLAETRHNSQYVELTLVFPLLSNRDFATSVTRDSTPNSERRSKDCFRQIPPNYQVRNSETAPRNQVELHAPTGMRGQIFQEEDSSSTDGKVTAPLVTKKNINDLLRSLCRSCPGKSCTTQGTRTASIQLLAFGGIASIMTRDAQDLDAILVAAES